MKKWTPTAILLCLLPLLLLWADEEEKKSQKQAQTQTQTQTQPQTGVTVTNEVIAQGTYSGLRDALAQVITSKQDWEALWKKHTSVLVPQPLIPEVDFNLQSVVAIFAGEKRTSGYRIIVKSISAQGNDLVLTYHFTEPAPNSFTLQVLSQPFILLRVQNPPGTVKLMKE